jgi:sec-independent protein translocase protein TatA
MGSIGATEILLIFLAVLLLFGAKRIPEIARGLGRGIREFKDATNDIKRELTVHDTPQIPPAAQQQQTQVYQQQQPVHMAPGAPPADPPPPSADPTQPPAGA